MRKTLKTVGFHADMIGYSKVIRAEESAILPNTTLNVMMQQHVNTGIEAPNRRKPVGDGSGGTQTDILTCRVGKRL